VQRPVYGAVEKRVVRRHRRTVRASSKTFHVNTRRRPARAPGTNGT
jgi:hypothetical protein